jgi:hypothetical protein
MKKGRLREVLDRARFASDGEYRVQFRDKEHLAEVSLEDFWEIADIVPEHRVARVLRDGEAVYQSSRKSLLTLPVERVTGSSRFRNLYG